MSDFNELSPDPFTAFTPPGDTGWRDWFLRLGAFLTNIVKTTNGYTLTEGQVVHSTVNGVVIDSNAIVVTNDVPCLRSALVADLPDPTTVPYGRMIATDSNATTFAAVVAGGGTDVVPIFSDGTDWRIG